MRDSGILRERESLSIALLKVVALILLWFISMILMISVVPRTGRTPGTPAYAQGFHQFLRIGSRADDLHEFHGFRDSDEDSDDFLWISRSFWFL